MAPKIGQQFERRLVDAFKRDYPTAWVHKNPTMNTGGGYAVEQAPDIVVVGESFTLLVEAKAAKGQTIPFNRLRDHQRDHLLAFDDAPPMAHGLVGVLSYNGLLGHARRYDGWLIPISEWVSLEKNLGRKSIPLYDDGVATYLEQYKMDWLPGTGFRLKHVVAGLLSSV